MNELRQNIAKVSGVFFFIMFLMLFFERVEFLGELLDKNDTRNSLKKAIKKEKVFEESEIKKDKDTYSKFSRFNLSNFTSVPKYKKEMLKFETVKQYQEKETKAMYKPNIIFSLIVFIALLATILIVLYQRISVVLILNALLTIVLIFYDIALVSAIKKMGLEKTFYSSWGVAESIQHILNIMLYIYIGVFLLLNRKKINKAKKGKSIKENIYEFAYSMLAPAIIVVIIIIVYPFLYNFRISFSSLNLKRFFSFIQGNKLSFNGVENYVSIFSDGLFWRTLMRTVIWTFTNLIFHVIAGVFLAIMLNRKMNLRNIYQPILILPWAIPQFIAVLVWRGMFNTRYGAVNLFLTRVVKVFKPWYQVEIPWLTDPFWLFTGAILTNIWLGIPFMMMIALGGLQSIPETYYEAADIDGASSWQKICHITIPQLKPVMTPAIIMGTVWTFNNLNVIYLLSNDTLTGKVDILVTYVYKAAFNLYRYGYAAAFSAVIFAILMIFSIIMIKVSKVEEGVR